MCRSRPSLRRAALISLTQRRCITFHELLSSLFALYLCVFARPRMFFLRLLVRPRLSLLPPLARPTYGNARFIWSDMQLAIDFGDSTSRIASSQLD